MRNSWIGLTLLIMGCQVGEESSAQRMPQRVEVDSAGLSVDQSRRTAITRAVEVVAPAVVSVSVTQVQRVQVVDPYMSDPFFQYFFGRRGYRTMERQIHSVGSGFLVSPDGFLVTNDHVVSEAVEVKVSMPDGRTFDASVIGSDPATDLAVLKVRADTLLPYLAFASSPVVVGEWAIALGNPFGLFEAADPSVSVGVVSAYGRDFEPQEGRIYRDMIQTDAAINQGNSGGPLVNALGEVIGVNTFIYTASGGAGSIGLGFAVPASKVDRIVTEIRTTGRVDRSYYTGLYGMDVTDRIAKAVGLSSREGIFVRDVDPRSPAAVAGIQPYDVIIALGDEAVPDRDGFVARLYDFRPGDSVSVTIWRDGAAFSTELVIGRQ